MNETAINGDGPAAYISATFTHDGVGFSVQAHTATAMLAIISELRGVEPRLGSAERPLTEADARADLEGKPRPSRASKAETPARAPAPAAASPAPAAPAASPASSSEPAASLDYEKDIKPLIVKLGATKGRDAVQAVLAGLNVAKGPEIKPEQYADAKAALDAALGA